MSKSLISMHREIQDKKLINKTLRNLMGWYRDHKITPSHLIDKIQELHSKGDEAVKLIDKRQSQELIPLLTQVQDLKKAMEEMGKKHALEKEAITIKYASVELDLLTEKIKDIPEGFWNAEVNATRKKILGFI